MHHPMHVLDAPGEGTAYAFVRPQYLKKYSVIGNVRKYEQKKTAIFVM